MIGNSRLPTMKKCSSSMTHWSDHGSQEKATRPATLTGGYYCLPAPGNPTICWDVVTCHQLGFDAEVGHVKMWNAETWGIRLLELADRYHHITDIDVHCSITS